MGFKLLFQIFDSEFDHVDVFYFTDDDFCDVIGIEINRSSAIGHSIQYHYFLEVYLPKEPLLPRRQHRLISLVRISRIP